MNRLSLALVVSIGTSLLLPVQAKLMSAPKVAVQQVTTEQTPDQLRQLAQSITVKVFAKNSSASGILIAKHGHFFTVLTNAHVTTPGQPYRIQTPDGKIHQATLAPGTSLQGNDLALLQFRAPSDYAVAKLGVSSPLRVNDEVLAAGFPFEGQGLELSRGRISLLPDKALRGGYQIAYTNAIQQGMSGGPLLNRQGEVIGINGLAAEPILSNAYRFQDGSQPKAAQLELWRRFSWGVPIQSAQLAGLPPQTPSPNSPAPSPKPQGWTGVVGEVNNIASQITVRIELPENENGSGVIIAKQGNTYYVLTADHVVYDKSAHQVRSNLQVVTPDVQQYPVNSSSIKRLEGVDLAVLQFTSNQNYRVASLAKYNLDSDKLVFVSGWPGSKPGEMTRAKRLFTGGILFRKLDGSSQVKDLRSLTFGYELVYSNITSGGMSGGPVLDTRGRVIGIHGRAEADVSNKNYHQVQLGYSLGVPISTFLSLANKVENKPEWLKVDLSAPPALTKQEQASIRDSLFTLSVPPTGTIKEESLNSWLNYGNELWRVIRFSEALTAFDKAIKIDPGSNLAWYARGMVLSTQQRYQESFAAFDKATQIAPKFYPAWRRRGIELYNLKRYPEALVSFDKAIDKAIALNHEYFDLYQLRGDVLYELRRYPEAIDAFSEAIRINPNPYAYNDRGVVYADLKDYKQALANYNEAIRLQPDFAGAYTNRGSVYAKLEDYKQALADFNEAIRIQPDFAEAYTNRGNIYHSLKDSKQALADFNEAIRLQPDFAKAYSNRANAYYDLKDYKQALADYNEAIRLQPHDLGEVYYNRGNVYRRLNDYKQALTDYNEAIRLQADNAEAYYNRATTYASLENYKQAIADFNEVIRLRPDYAEAYLYRGITYVILGGKQEAIADLQKASQLLDKQRDLASYQLAQDQLRKLQQ